MTGAAWDVAEELAKMRSEMAKWGWPDDYIVEHAIDEGLAGNALGHSVTMGTAPPQHLYRLTIFHAPACGCNAIPDEVVLNG